MFLRRLLLLALALAGCTTLTLPPSRPIARPVSFRGAYEEFPSGLRLVVHEDPQASRVTMAVSYRVGATDEPAGKAGLAHLVEHLTFLARHGGAQAPRLSSQLLSSGAEYNAVTSHDGTDYFFTAPPEQFSRLAALEAQRLKEPLANLTEEDFQVARDVVVAELRQRYETSPEGAQQVWLHEVLLEGHPYGRAAGGTPESVQRLTLEDTRAFVKAHYTPAHAVVVVSGPLPPALARAEVELGFAGLTGVGLTRPIPPVQRTPPPFPAEVRRPPLEVRRGPVEYPRLWLVWTLPGLYSGKTPQARAAQGMMSQSMSTRLAQEEKVHNVSVTLQVLDGVTLLIASIDLMKEEDAEEVADVALDQLIALGTDPRGTGLRTAGARAMLLTQAFSDLEHLPVREVARYLRATGEADYVSGWLRHISEELTRDISPYLYQYVRRERARLLLVAPERTGRGRTVMGERFAPLVGPEDFGDEELMLPPGALDVRSVAQAPGLDQAERFVLGNGLRVVALRRGRMPVVEARLWWRTQPPSPGGPSLALARLGFHGSYLSSARSRRHGAKVGARSQLLLREDGMAAFTVAFPSGNLPHVLEDIQGWMWDSEVELRPFEYVHAWQLRQLEREATRTDVRAERELMARLFPGHAYGLAPSVAEAQTLTQDQATDWVDGELSPDRATLLLVGDLPPTPKLRQQLGDLLFRWKGRGGPVTELPEPPLPRARSVVVVDRPGASQAELRVGLRWPWLSVQEDATASALEWLLEHRLDRQLRERLGLTYGVVVSHEVRPRATALLVRTAVERSAAAGALEQLLAELGTVEAEPLPREVVERARWQVARGYDLRFQATAAVADRLWELERLGLPTDYWERYPEAIAAVTPESVQALARRLNLGAEVVVILGDAAALKPQLESAGFQVEVRE
jgi:zinc protease